MSLFGPDNRDSIKWSPELHRIKELPRRTWAESDLLDLASQMTQRLRTPNGTQTLRPKQALALYELRQQNGGVVPLGVGLGKTLVTLLAPMVLDPIPTVPLLMLPASLIHKTEVEMAEYAKHWRIATHQRMQSYDMLSRVQCADFLAQYHPDYIGMDEAHRAKNRRAGVTKRLIRYFAERPTTRCMVLSGTLASKSIQDMAHLSKWSLKQGAPVPFPQGEVDEWADALDEDVNPLKRMRPGAILTFGGFDANADEVTRGRQAFRARFLETPGVISGSRSDGVNTALNVSAVRYPETEVTNAHFTKLRNTWTTPDGWAFSTAITAWRHGRELALGMHSVWDPRPPPEWLEARRNWAAYCRDVLSYSRHLDTELQVKMAVDSGELKCPELAVWQKIEPTFTANPKPIWHDTSALDFAQAWMEKHTGLVWCEHVFFAKELARRSGVPYYGEGGLTEDGKNILEMERSAQAGKVPLILSVRANSTGRNLQAWSDNLITTGIGRAKDLEQLIGRTHRHGQKADEVNVEIMLGCWETWNAWQHANAQTIAARDTYGEEYKLLSATKDFPDERELKSWSGDRWTKQAVKPTDGTAASIWGEDDEDE